MSDGWGFSGPSTADRFKASEHVGALVAFIRPTLEKERGTDFGDGKADAAHCPQVALLDGDDAGTLFDDVLVFGKALVPALTGEPAAVILGRLAEGTPSKPGFAAPILLNDPTDADLEVAQGFFDAYAQADEDGNVSIVGADEAPF